MKNEDGKVEDYQNDSKEATGDQKEEEKVIESENTLAMI